MGSTKGEDEHLSREDLSIGPSPAVMVPTSVPRLCPHQQGSDSCPTQPIGWWEREFCALSRTFGIPVVTHLGPSAHPGLTAILRWRWLALYPGHKNSDECIRHKIQRLLWVALLKLLMSVTQMCGPCKLGLPLAFQVGAQAVQ